MSSKGVGEMEFDPQIVGWNYFHRHTVAKKAI